MSTRPDGGDPTLPIAVVGGGIAGVTAAAYLRRRGISCVLYERAPQLAGLAQSHCDADGFTSDVGAHFVTNRLAAAIGIGAHCRTVRYYGESVWLNGRAYAYPFGLLRNVRFAASGVIARLGARTAAPPHSAADIFRAAYGRSLADAVAIPLLEAWSGVPASELAPVAAEKLQHGVARTAALKVAGLVMRRAVTIGFSHEMPENAHVWHVYPEGGVSRLVEHLANEVRDAVQYDSPVDAVIVRDARVCAVRVRGRELAVRAVVSTAPVHALAGLVTGTDALAYLARFRYRPMIFVSLRLDGRNLISDTVMWTPERTFPFFRVTDTTRSMPWLAPAGKSMLTVDVGCEVGDATWRMPEPDLVARCLDALEMLVPGVRARDLGSARVVRTAIAYPVLLNAYEADRQRFVRSPGVAGLSSVGRNGEFAHILMEDVYWRTLGAIRRLVDGLDTGHAEAPTSTPA
ncbi:MAG TPA: FAD-dependent oxidoreductase [Gemmatirosa sp.]